MTFDNIKDERDISPNHKFYTSIPDEGKEEEQEEEVSIVQSALLHVPTSNWCSMQAEESFPPSLFR